MPLLPDKVLVELLVVEALLHAAQEGVIELADVFFLADLDGLALVVRQRLQHLSRVRVLLVALRHMPEEDLQVAYELPRRLEPVQELLFLGVLNWGAVLGVAAWSCGCAGGLRAGAALGLLLLARRRR